ncbi:unnamed protein product [Rotaria sordida]|uniref:Serine/threonine-protein kinase ULK4/RUNKEL HEAT repeats domain-containing protein n=1 Tax=Rotaria sordida TaxID=392033 RepID=A0A818Y6U7_9BILA|nr:unnamed protein product [Rotaria sordida]CAF0927251.1 unnamed protein product [Rotaria sordida]CAF0940585.1 unnamed protein product [Rotaria sordida]CAF3575116.1 unnamed protein product [Rotaria sordida]CAF3750410.1 unnamed protein product [Rotaria sordida]
MKATRLLGIIFNKATDNFPLSSSLTDILVSLTETLRANSKETKFKLYLLQAIGEIMIFIAGRASDNSLVPGFTYQLIGRCLKDGDDIALNHAACKIIENLLLVADKQADKLATSDIALALWNISSTGGNNEHIRASALAALCHMGLSYLDIVQSVFDKVTIKSDIFQSTSSKVLQYNITLLAILAKRTKNRTMFIQDILPKMNVLYENTNVLIRAKAYTLTYVLLSTYSESLYTLSDTKLFQAIERDVRRTSADPDENDLLHEALNRLTTLLSSHLNRILDELLSSTEQTRKTSSAKDAFKKWLSSFRLISTIIGNHCIRSRVVTLMSIKKLFKLFTNIKLIAELNSELTKGPSSLTEIISYVSQTLDAFVRARDLLSLFSEILLSDLLPLCSQLLVSSNVDEFSLCALCILNELLNELKLTDCVLPIHIQHDIKQELYQTFLPIICDRHILREEPIALLSLRFIQTIWVLIDHTSNSFSILLQSNLITNLFNLIIQNKDKSTGTFVQGIVSCLTILSEKREIIQTMIEQGLVSIQLQLIQDQLTFTTPDRAMTNVLLELLSLLDRDLTYVLDIVKRALQVKKTGTGDSDLPSTAEKLLQVHKPLVTLVGPMINLLPNEDPSIAKIALHNLSLLTQLIGSEGKAILSKNHCHILSTTLRTTDTTKQKLLLRALKRLISGDKRSLDVARSNTNNELTQTLQQLKKSAATEADAGLISHIDDLLHLLL